MPLSRSMQDSAPALQTVQDMQIQKQPDPACHQPKQDNHPIYPTRSRLSGRVGALVLLGGPRSFSV